jgi:hypothetical protein
VERSVVWLVRRRLGSAAGTGRVATRGPFMAGCEKRCRMHVCLAQPRRVVIGSMVSSCARCGLYASGLRKSCAMLIDGEEVSLCLDPSLYGFLCQLLRHSSTSSSRATICALVQAQCLRFVVCGVPYVPVCACASCRATVRLLLAACHIRCCNLCSFVLCIKCWHCALLTYTTYCVTDYDY